MSVADHLVIIQGTNGSEGLEFKNWLTVS